MSSGDFKQPNAEITQVIHPDQNANVQQGYKSAYQQGDDNKMHVVDQTNAPPAFDYSMYNQGGIHSSIYQDAKQSGQVP